MSRIVSRKGKRNLRIEAIITIVFILSLVGFLGSVTLLRSYNVILASHENVLENKIETEQNDVANLELDVKQLDNRERILKVAEAQGLKVNQEKIVSVNTND